MLKQPDWFATSAAGLRLAGEEMIADSGEAHGRQHPAGIHVESLEGTGRVLRDRYRNADTSARTIDAPDARALVPRTQPPWRRLTIADEGEMLSQRDCGIADVDE